MSSLRQYSFSFESYREIPLTHGQSTIVDSADYEWLNQYKWYAWRSRPTGEFYATRVIYVDGKQYRFSMQRFILGLKHGDKRVGDHKNRNPLDNRRANLRIATRQQNTANSKVSRNSTTGIKGVTREAGKWRAMIGVGGKRISLGCYETQEEAHAAYCRAAVEHFGEFARFE